MKRVVHLVVSVMSRHPIRWMAPTARIRNPAIGLIRQAGHTKIVVTIRKIKNDLHLLLSILDLHPTCTPPSP